MSTPKSYDTQMNEAKKYEENLEFKKANHIY